MRWSTWQENCRYFFLFSCQPISMAVVKGNIRTQNASGKSLKPNKSVFLYVKTQFLVETYVLLFNPVCGKCAAAEIYFIIILL